jgi:hypothetical protein
MQTVTLPEPAPGATAPLVPAPHDDVALAGPPVPAASDRLRLARLLVLLEALVAGVSAVEAAVVAAVGFGVFGSAAGTAGLAVTLAWQARRLGHGRVTRTLRLCQWAFLGAAAVDLLIAVVVVHGVLLPVSLLVRTALPLAVLRLTRLTRRIRQTRRPR